MNKRKRYDLAELLAQCDADAPENPDLRAWLDAPDIGLEIIEDGDEEKSDGKQ